VIDQQRIRVLIADHDRWTRSNVSNLLGEAGFAVEQASNGMAALRMAAADPPHIVLIGNDLPEVTSADVVRSLRSNPRTRRTAVLEVQRLADSVQLLVTQLGALEARNEGRGHERPQTGTPVRVSPQRSHLRGCAGARLSKRLCSALTRN
jgi:CheY-like chemotaxis protein